MPNKEKGSLRRNFDLKRREARGLPPEKLREILARIYPEETTDELMDRFFERSNNNAED
jgi:hypothetical protein